MFKYYDLYTKEVIISMFPKMDKIDWFCDNNFAVIGNDVVCLFNIDENLPKAELDSHNRVKWRPKNFELNGESFFNSQKLWFPDQLCEKGLKYHLFVFVKENLYCYLGEPHLSGYGGSYNKAPNVTAKFSLFNTIPYKTWIKIGGYKGWKMTLCTYPTETYISDDIESLITFLSKVDQSNMFFIEITTFDDIGVSIYLHKKGVYLIMFSDKYFKIPYLLDTKDKRKTEVYWDNGEPMEVTMEEIIPFDLALKVIEYFLFTQKESTLVNWKELG